MAETGSKQSLGESVTCNLETCYAYLCLLQCILAPDPNSMLTVDLEPLWCSAGQPTTWGSCIINRFLHCPVKLVVSKQHHLGEGTGIPRALDCSLSSLSQGQSCVGSFSPS